MSQPDERIDFDDLGACEGGGCPNDATIVSEEGHRWCRGCAHNFYALVARLNNEPPRFGLDA